MKNYKKITLELRVNRYLHGDKPCVITVIPNDGKIFSPKKNQMYVMTILNDNKLYFHRISNFFHDYMPNEDFRLSLDKVKAYTIESKKKNLKRYTLSTNEGLFFQFDVLSGLKETYETDHNLESIKSTMRSMGIKEEKLGD